MAHNYQLQIFLPQNYSLTESYPVLYVLGHSDYHYKNAQERLNYEGKIENIIIVSIGFNNNNSFESYAKRHYQFTPSEDIFSNSQTEKNFNLPKGTVKSGGAKKFLECIKTEIAPFIDNHYKTNADRGISGNNLGGLFTAYCFINSNGFFTRFGINYPSLKWNENEILNQAILKFSKKKTWSIPPTKVFISSFKPFVYVLGQKKSNTPIEPLKFSNYLKNSNYKNIDVTYQMLVKESNTSIAFISSGRTLSVLYEKNQEKVEENGIQYYYKYSNFYNLSAPDYNINKDSLAVQGYDLTEYFTNNRAIKGSRKYIVKYNRIKYFFLNEENKSIFSKNPEKFLPQFGGYCADKMGAIFIGSSSPPGKHPVDPKYFMIVDNKLYLFGYGNETYLKRWKKNKKNLEDSYKVWRSISKQN